MNEAEASEDLSCDHLIDTHLLWNTNRTSKTMQVQHEGCFTHLKLTVFDVIAISPVCAILSAVFRYNAILLANPVLCSVLCFLCSSSQKQICSILLSINVVFVSRVQCQEFSRKCTDQNIALVCNIFIISLTSW